MLARGRAATSASRTTGTRRGVWLRPDGGTCCWARGRASSALPITPPNVTHAVHVRRKRRAGSQDRRSGFSATRSSPPTCSGRSSSRRAPASGKRLRPRSDGDRGAPTSSPHGSRLARVHYAEELIPEIGQPLHVLLELPDYLGSSSIVIDQQTSELVERSTYLAYGGAESDYRPTRWGSFREDYKFTGKEEDVEVGIQYFGKRYYSAELNRWISADPLTVQGLGGDDNVYAYVHGQALRATDPIGLETTSSSSSSPSTDNASAAEAAVPFVFEAKGADAPAMYLRGPISAVPDTPLTFQSPQDAINYVQQNHISGASIVVNTDKMGTGSQLRSDIHDYFMQQMVGPLLGPAAAIMQTGKQGGSLTPGGQGGGGEGANPQGVQGNVGTQQTAGPFTGSDAAMTMAFGPGSANGKSGGVPFGLCSTCQGSSLGQGLWALGQIVGSIAIGAIVRAQRTRSRNRHLASAISRSRCPH